MHARCVLVLISLALRQAAATTTAPHWLELSWLFDWNPDSEPYPVPTTAQCETLHIKSDRGSATGPDAVPPYFLQVYTSFLSPFIIPAGMSSETNLTIPFAPGTQYQICMYDSKNSTGGCQAMYSVYPNPTNPEPTCDNFTIPTRNFNVLSEDSHGTLSRFGWVESCSDIRVTPQEGTPPFIFTVTPSLHPPLNITSNDMSPINWTVNLSWGTPFFITLIDSTGLSWTNGPIHSGNGDTACLSDSYSAARRSSVTTAVAGGAAVAGTVVGVLLSLLAAFLIRRRRKSRSFSNEGDEKITPFNSLDPPHLESRGRSRANYRSGITQSTSSRLSLKSLPTLPRPSYNREGKSRRPRPLRSGTADSDAALIPAPQESYSEGNNMHVHTGSPTSLASTSQVYLIHNDSGRAPVRVVTSNDTQVVELPPGYSANYSPALASSEVQGGSLSPRTQLGSEKSAVASGSGTREAS